MKSSKKEWQKIRKVIRNEVREKGIIQRAELVTRLMADGYNISLQELSSLVRNLSGVRSLRISPKTTSRWVIYYVWDEYLREILHRKDAK